MLEQSLGSSAQVAVQLSTGARPFGRLGMLGSGSHPTWAHKCIASLPAPHRRCWLPSPETADAPAASAVEIPLTVFLFRISVCAVAQKIRCYLGSDGGREIFPASVRVLLKSFQSHAARS